jgi:DNA-binding NarL/FixJ family response regulator
MSCGPILIVDDDAPTRDLLVHLLTDSGYDTVEASTGERAMTLASERRPALVLLDVHLGNLSGYEICQRLRERFGQLLPIIFVSGESVEAHDRAAGLLLGADDYMTKPFSPDELVARVRRAVARARAAAAVQQPDPLSAASELTQRELQVLELLAGGFRPDAIAREFSISAHTVATHIQRILGKLNVHTRAEAIAYAYRLSLVGAPRERIP